MFGPALHSNFEPNWMIVKFKFKLKLKQFSEPFDHFDIDMKLLNYYYF
jgi:hypothetical protein